MHLMHFEHLYCTVNQLYPILCLRERIFPDLLTPFVVVIAVHKILVYFNAFMPVIIQIYSAFLIAIVNFEMNHVEDIIVLIVSVKTSVMFATNINAVLAIHA